MSRQGGGKRPPLKVAFSAMRNSNYRLLWFGQLVSLSGTWMQRVAQSWLVLRITDSPLALGLITTVQFAPIMMFSLFGGVFADRLPRRKLIMVTQTVMLVQALVFAILQTTGHLELGYIYVLAAVLGVASAADQPARQAFLMEIVGPDDLPNAVALNSTQFNVSRIVGPALGGIALATIGVAGCMYLNAVSYVAVIGGLFLMRPARFFETHEAIRGNVFKQLGEGVKYALTTPDIAFIVLVLAILGTFGYNFLIMLPLISKFVLHSGPAGFGVLTSAMGVGAVFSALGMAYLGNPTRERVLWGGAGFSVLLIAMAFARTWWLAIPLTMMLGAFSITFQATASTRLQLLAPPNMRGRIMSIYQLLFAGSTPIGSVIFGWLADHLGVPQATFIVGTCCAVGVMAGLLFVRRAAGRLLPDEQEALDEHRAENRRAAGLATEAALTAEGEVGGGE